MSLKDTIMKTQIGYYLDLMQKYPKRMPHNANEIKRLIHLQYGSDIHSKLSQEGTALNWLSLDIWTELQKRLQQSVTTK